MDPYVHMAVEIKRLFLYQLRYGIIYQIRLRTRVRKRRMTSQNAFSAVQSGYSHNRGQDHEDIFERH